MRSGSTILTGMVVALMVEATWAAPAPSLTAKASLAKGVVTVTGSKAAKGASISWEGIPVTTASKGGGFTFTTMIIPLDCIGTLSDGAASIEVRIDGCSDVTTGLPGTGQLESYAPGDDGDVRAGGPLSYTDNGNGTVTDNRTGLMWEKKTSLSASSYISWQAALDYVAGLNAMNGGAGFAGHNDWRLPNVKELLSIVDYGRSNPSIDPIFGPTIGIVPHARYWTSTSWAAYYPEVNAWAVEFADGYADPTSVAPYSKSSALLVRAVRGGL